MSSPSRSNARSARSSAARSLGPGPGPGSLGVACGDRADDVDGLDEEVDALEELEEVSLLEEQLAVHDRALRVVAVVQRLPVLVVHAQDVVGGEGLVRADDPGVGDLAVGPLSKQV